MDILHDVDLTSFNTLALPARAAQLLRVTRVEQILALSQTPWHRSPRFILGGGSNLVLPARFDGLMLQMAIPGRRLLGEDGDAWYVEAAAGESWHDFVEWTLAQGWPGLENLVLIPGTVGAAPIQNIGAYGLEVSERIHSLQAIDVCSGEKLCLDRAACRFAYRDSLFKQEGWHLDGRYVIVSVCFRLPKRWRALTRYADLASELSAQGQGEPTARQVADAVMALRRRKLPAPTVLPNAGSFFQNPVVDRVTAGRLRVAYPTLPQYPQADGRSKLAAGWRIEQAGWKGRRCGPAGMYEKQALVLINHGGAQVADVLTLMQAVQRDVRTLFAVDLLPEPVFPGRKSPA